MRVVYRGDLDGTVSAAILVDIGLCDDALQAHPKDMQDGKVEITDQDILCNLPYHPNCNMWFDHHSSEIDAAEFPTDFKGLVEVAPSAAGLVYKYFLKDYPKIVRFEELVRDTDLYDSAKLTLEQIQNPQGAILLGILLDPRTGLGLIRDYTISNFNWLSQMPKYVATLTVEEVLALPDTQERIRKYTKLEPMATSFYRMNSHLDGNVIVSDVRGKIIPPANRFLIYTLPEFAEGNISVRLATGKKGEFNTISVAKSIFKRDSKVDAGALCKKYGGGGHAGAATCQPSIDDSDRIFEELVAACKE